MDTVAREKLQEIHSVLYYNGLRSLQPKNSFRCGAPWYAIKYGNDPSFLAAADESGIVYILSIETDEIRLDCQTQVHTNSIFDLSWSQDSTKILTASGDLTAKVCDIETEMMISLTGHYGSVKSIRNSPINPNVYATASRDGKIFLWDTRVAEGKNEHGESTYAPIGTIWNEQISPLFSNKSRTPGSSSFTGAEFISCGQLIVSSEANDPHIKIWDIRKLHCKRQNIKLACKIDQTTHKKIEAVQLQERLKLSGNYLSPRFTRDNSPSRPYFHEIENIRVAGNTGISIWEDGTTVAVSSANHIVYIYSNLPQVTKPVELYGHVSSFFTKAVLSPDGRYVISGSAGNHRNFHIWDIGFPNRSTRYDNAHTMDVNYVDWSRGSSQFIATCSDDCDVILWDFD